MEIYYVDFYKRVHVLIVEVFERAWVFSNVSFTIMPCIVSQPFTDCVVSQPPIDCVMSQLPSDDDTFNVQCADEDVDQTSHDGVLAAWLRFSSEPEHTEMFGRKRKRLCDILYIRYVW